MRITLLFGLIVMLASCGNEDVNNPSEEVMEETEIEVLPETEPEPKANCYYNGNLAENLSKEVIVGLLGEGNYSKSVRLDRAESFINCMRGNDIELLSFGDESCCAPNSYDLQYQVLMDGEAIFSFRMTAGADMKFEPVSTIIEEQLKGYKQLLDGKFDVSYREAKKIAEQNGANLSEVSLELVLNEKKNHPNTTSYHWEVELEYDHNSVVLLQIDATTGKTSTSTLELTNIE